jgi:hypothetical protein
LPQVRDRVSFAIVFGDFTNTSLISAPADRTF